jgi:hypothetical protein
MSDFNKFFHKFDPPFIFLCNWVVLNGQWVLWGTWLILSFFKDINIFLIFEPVMDWTSFLTTLNSLMAGLFDSSNFLMNDR